LPHAPELRSLVVRPLRDRSHRDLVRRLARESDRAAVAEKHCEGTRLVFRREQLSSFYLRAADGLDRYLRSLAFLALLPDAGRTLVPARACHVGRHPHCLGEIPGRNRIHRRVNHGHNDFLSPLFRTSRLRASLAGALLAKSYPRRD